MKGNVWGKGEVTEFFKKKINSPFLNRVSWTELWPLTLASQKHKKDQVLGTHAHGSQGKEQLGRGWQILMSVPDRNSQAAISFPSLCLLHLWIFPVMAQGSFPPPSQGHL